MAKIFFENLSVSLRLAVAVSAILIAGACSDDESGVIAPEETSSSVEEISSSENPLSSSDGISSSESSSSVKSSSSVATPWDYMNPGLSYGEIVDSRDGKVYKTLWYGKYNWMAENLNYDVGDTLHSWCARDNCNLYGRLYTFALAMDSAKSGCGFGSVCTVPENFQGICPDGWHLPETKEFYDTFNHTHDDFLFRADVPKWGDSLYTNVYGLTIFPVGYARFDSFGELDMRYWDAYFWSAVDANDSMANAILSLQNEHGFLFMREAKKNGFSVRCIENYEHMGDTLVAPSSVKKGEFTDARDGQVYKTVTIGRQTWMAENLNYADSAKSPILKGRTAVARANEPDSNKLYGLLYTWPAAMDSGSQDYSFLNEHFNQGDFRGICPENWHLPKRSEFNELLNVTIGGTYEDAHALKANVGWYKFPGDDEYGLSLVGAGWIVTGSNDPVSSYQGVSAMWTADPVYDVNKVFLNSRAYIYTLDERHINYYEYVADTIVYRSNFHSIRCIKDE